MVAGGTREAADVTRTHNGIAGARGWVADNVSRTAPIGISNLGKCEVME